MYLHIKFCYILFHLFIILYFLKLIVVSSLVYKLHHCYIWLYFNLILELYFRSNLILTSFLNWQAWARIRVQHVQCGVATWIGFRFPKGEKVWLDIYVLFLCEVVYVLNIIKYFYLLFYNHHIFTSIHLLVFYFMV